MATTPPPEMPPIVKGLLREILSEPGTNGTGSAARSAMMLIQLAAVTWVSYCVYKTGTLSMDVVMAALTFSGGGTLATYGVNKASGVIQKKD